MGDEEKEENPVVIEMEWVDSIEWGCHWTCTCFRSKTCCCSSFFKCSCWSRWQKRSTRGTESKADNHPWECTWRDCLQATFGNHNNAMSKRMWAQRALWRRSRRMERGCRCHKWWQTARNK
jgi:hypothetical protein